ncbi:AFG1/ZapE family ATPase, partial [Luteimonas sp. SDU101]|uniref:AFG1/ZapE family ATPase n=1 Tax=Luteimonas sp. SDU101 TaxID=3422593 RepID=UPI003EB99074
MREPDAAATPSTHYRAGVERGEWSDDPAQRGALQALDRIHAALSQPEPRVGLMARLLGTGRADAPQGLYLWGGVGRGKTFLVDLFYAGLPLPEVRGAALASGALPQPAPVREV